MICEVCGDEDITYADYVDGKVQTQEMFKRNCSSSKKKMEVKKVPFDKKKKKKTCSGKWKKRSIQINIIYENTYVIYKGKNVRRILLSGEKYKSASLPKKTEF